MLASGIGLSVADALVVGQFTDVEETMTAAMVRVPALWSIAGIGVLLYGLRRQFSTGVWVAFTVVVIVFLFGSLLRLPAMVMNLSPIGHLTHLPADDQPWMPVAVLCAIAATAVAGGVAAFGRRDVDCG